MGVYAGLLLKLLPTSEGGRSNPVNLIGYRPHIRIQGGDGEFLGVEFIDATKEVLQPGEATEATASYLYEDTVSYEAIDLGVKVDVLEGGKVVGTGEVTGLYGLDVDWQEILEWQKRNSEERRKGI
jgi:hypothetical protein